MTAWHSLYLSSEQSEQIITAIHDYFDANGYKIYNPFGDLPSMSYPQTLKIFLAPARNKWIRLLIDGDTDASIIESLASYLSQNMDCLSVRLDSNIGSVHAFRDGSLLDLGQWAQMYVSAGHDISAILNADSFNLPNLSEGQIGDIPLASLPEDIQQMAQQVNAKEANKLFEKLSNRLLKAIGRSDARNLLNEQVNWDSQGGQYIRTVMDKLTIPDNWRTPDFVTVRTAYTIDTQQRRGITSSFAGDDAVLKAVPNVLDYHVIYGGKME